MTHFTFHKIAELHS